MLSMLCGRINEQSKDILNDQSESEHEKYLKMYDYIKKSDKIVILTDVGILLPIDNGFVSQPQQTE